MIGSKTTETINLVLIKLNWLFNSHVRKLQEFIILSRKTHLHILLDNNRHSNTIDSAVGKETKLTLYVLLTVNDNNYIFTHNFNGKCNNIK